MPLDPTKIRAARERATLTMQEAAERLGTKHTAAKTRWYQLETGRIANPSLETVEGMCRVLGVGIDELLSDDSPAMPARRRGSASKS